MRLIDADELISKLHYRGLTEDEKCWNYALRKLVKEQPTDYDVEKVIEKLFDVAIERYGNDGGMGGEMVVNLDDAVEIVKAGGIDE